LKTTRDGGIKQLGSKIKVMAKEKKERKSDSAHGKLSATQQKEHHKRQSELADELERQRDEASGAAQPSGKADKKRVGAHVPYKKGKGGAADVAAAHPPKASGMGTRGERRGSRPQKAP
jgi:hypothetical protein